MTVYEPDKPDQVSAVLNTTLFSVLQPSKLHYHRCMRLIVGSVLVEVNGFSLVAGEPQVHLILERK